MVKLAGKVAIITGAASGIGRETLRRFLAEGALVVSADLHPGRGEPGSEPVLPWRMDVSEEADWTDCVAAAEARFGRVDILVNNAGIGIPKPLMELTLAEWRQVMAVNLDGVFLGIRAVVPALRRAGGGAIVNVDSIMSLVAAVNAAPYCASKGGVTALTRAAALEMAESGDDIRVNTVHPGFVTTPLLADRLDRDPARREMLLSGIPTGRLGSAADVAAAIVHLASDDARYMTGSGIVVDGGYTAR